jgi:uncharacterized YigZ family protein
LLWPARGEAAAQERLEEVRRSYPDATHHCWAWRLGARGDERSSDDGEPAGTAGAPMLQVLRGADLSDVLAVVVRWYGGVKLGKGGLARAYAEATRLALDGLPTVLRVPTEEVRLELPYDRLGAVKRLVNPPAVELAGETYGAAVELLLSVHRHRLRELEESLAELGLSIEERASEGSTEDGSS